MTTNFPLVSNGDTSTPSFKVLPIAGGGTNATSMATSTGIVKYDGTRLVTSTTALIDSSNRMTNTSQPAFLASIGSANTNVTGDGTTATVVWDTESYDIGSNYSTSTGIFTAPVTGVYLFTVCLPVSDIGVLHTSLIATITTSGGSPQIRMNPASGAVSGIFAVSFSSVMNLSASGTAKVDVTVSGGTKIIDVPTGIGGYFGGQLLS